ncbi:MAG TPA: PDZ domain-containing protein [Polyangiaceae bacterium]|nr:PDZ domain-containing protein [Polyangiaceae bacterium]
MASTRLREGDLLELRGDAFPEGRAAEVTLRGEVSRAGEPRARHFELSLPGRSVSTHAVSVDVTRPVERAFSGSTSPSHATFHGSIEVSFAPRVARTPPVTGVLPDVTLDFLPAEGDSATLEARREEGAKFAEFIGVLLADDRAVPTVSGVMPGSAAERAGVVLGDRLRELAGVHVLGVDDLVPPPRARSAELVVERDDRADGRRLVVDVTGFRPLLPRDLGAGAALIASALALLFLLASPFGRALSFIEHRLLERLRSRDTALKPPLAGARRPPSRAARLVQLLPMGIGSYAVFVVTNAVVAATALGVPIVAREIDLPILVVLSFTALALASFVFGAPGERGIWARTRRALLVLVQALPALGALACLGLAVGSYGPDALALAQGAAPWDWLAFKSPVLLAAASLLVLSLVPEVSRGRSIALALAAEKGRAERRQAAAALMGQAQLLIVSGVTALAFFGGARLPGTSSSLAPSLGLALASVLWLLLKAWAIAGSVTALRWVLGRLDIDEVRGLTLRAGVPLAAALVVLAALAREKPFERWLAASDRGLGWACLAGWLTLAVLVARRVAAGRALADGERGPNPWL